MSKILIFSNNQFHSHFDINVFFDNFLNDLTSNLENDIDKIVIYEFYLGLQQPQFRQENINNILIDIIISGLPLSKDEFNDVKRIYILGVGSADFLFIKDYINILLNIPIIFIDFQQNLPIDYRKYRYYYFADKVVLTNYYSYLNFSLSFPKRKGNKKKEFVFPPLNIPLVGEDNYIDNIINKLTDFQYIYVTEYYMGNIEVFLNLINNLGKRGRAKHILFVLGADQYFYNYYVNNLMDKVSIIPLMRPLTEQDYKKLFDISNVFFTVKPNDYFNINTFYALKNNVPIITLPTGNANLFGLKDWGKIVSENIIKQKFINLEADYLKGYNIVKDIELHLTNFDGFTSYFSLFLKNGNAMKEVINKIWELRDIKKDVNYDNWFRNEYKIYNFSLDKNLTKDISIIEDLDKDLIINKKFKGIYIKSLDKWI